MENFRELDPSITGFKAPEQAESALKEKLKKALLKTVAFSVMLGGHMAGYSQSRAPETRARIVPSAAEKSEKTETRKSFTVDQIRERLRTDPNERIFIRTNADPAGKLYELSGGEVSNGILNYDEIDQTIAAEKEKVTGVEIAHTHQLAAYGNVFKNFNIGQSEVEDYRSGKKDLPPHPPSMNDFLSELNLQNEYGARNLQVESKVIDGAGVWSYTVDKDSWLLNEVKIAREEFSQNLENTLTAQDWEILSSINRSGEIDPKKISEYLQQRTETEDPSGAKRKLGQKLASAETVNRSRYGKSMEVFSQMESAGAAVIVAKSAAEREEAMAKYVRLCADNGIHLKFISK